MLAIVAPGQGNLSPGFLRPWLDHPGFTELLASYEARLDRALGRTGGAGGDVADHEIRDTAVAQPLLVAVGLAAARALGPASLDSVGAVAGHSVGELTTAALSSTLSDDDVLDLLRARGDAMAAAARRGRTGMTAVLGGAPEEVRHALRRHGLDVAVVNAPRHLVAAGERSALDALAEQPPARSRLVGLGVAGAFHTEHMRPAVAPWRRALALATVRDPRIPWLSNRDGAQVGSGDDVASRLLEQVVRPVRWDLCLETLGRLRVTGVVELPPAGTLGALVRRALPTAEVHCLHTPADLEDVASFVARHASR